MKENKHRPQMTGALIPEELKKKLLSKLASQGKRYREWLIKQMKKEVEKK
jgi:hypothetical protein